MDGGVEQTLPSALRGLPVARVFLDVRDETCVEDGFAVVPGVKSAVEIEMRAVNVQIRQSGHPLQGVQSLWQEYGIGPFTGATGSGASTKPLLSTIAMIFSPL